MEMVNIHSGKLRAIGYDASTRTLRVELDDGSTLDYKNVPESLWRSFSSASTQWSYYRDNIEEAFTAHRVSSKMGNMPDCRKSLDDLFK